jgi:hypothetical protein
MMINLRRSFSEFDPRREQLGDAEIIVKWYVYFSEDAGAKLGEGDAGRTCQEGCPKAQGRGGERR